MYYVYLTSLLQRNDCYTSVAESGFVAISYTASRDNIWNACLLYARNLAWDANSTLEEVHELQNIQIYAKLT